MTKIIDVRLGADGSEAPSREGWIIVSYCAPEGGRTNIGAPIIARDGVFPTWGEVAALLFNNMGRNEWPAFIQAKLSETAPAVRLSVPDEVDDIVFASEFNPTIDQSGRTEANPAFISIAEEKF